MKPKTHLSPEEKQKIVSLHGKAGAPRLARQYDVCTSTIYRLWKNAGVSVRRKKGKKAALKAAVDANGKLHEYAKSQRKNGDHVTTACALDREAYDALSKMCDDYDMSRKDILSLLVRREAKHKWVPEFKKMTEELM